MIDATTHRTQPAAVAHATAATGTGGPSALDARMARAAAATDGAGVQGWAPQPAQPLILAQGTPPAGPPAVGRATPPATPDVVTLARLSQAAYTNAATPIPGWSQASDAQLRELGLTDEQLSSTTSAFQAHVYVNGAGTDQRFVVAFRGSTTDRSDWISSGRQAAGLPSDHYSRALAVGDRIARSGSDAVTITGHSLGGGLAAAAAIAAGEDAVTFNASGLHANTIRDGAAVARNAGVTTSPDVRALHVRGEILSLLQDGGDQALGGALGALVTRSWGGARAGANMVDAPSAFGTRTTLDARRPADMPWYADNPGSRHGIAYVLSSLGAR